MAAHLIRGALRFCTSSAWLLQLFGILKWLPPMFVLAYHLAEQLLFCTYVVPVLQANEHFRFQIFSFLLFELTSVLTVATVVRVIRTPCRPTLKYLPTVGRLCKSCKVPRIPRSYHCNVCGICVPLFDHHCAWLNACVGQHNRRTFIHFLLLLGAHGISTALLLYRHIWQLDIRNVYKMAVLAQFVLSCGLGISGYIMATMQVLLVARNQTTREFFLNKPRDVRPVLQNLQSVFGYTWLEALVPFYDLVRAPRYGKLNEDHEVV